MDEGLKVSKRVWVWGLKILTPTKTRTDRGLHPSSLKQCSREGM